MSVCITNDGGIPIPLSESEVMAICDHVLAYAEVERACNVSVSIVDADEIRGLNSQWRSIDAPTDVLSFECDSPWDEDIPAEEPCELGDVILCPQVIAEQAPEFGSTPLEEFRLMLVHGLLHLLGFDHIEPDDAAEMEAAELEVLQDLARQRGEDPALVRIGPTTSHIDD